MLNSQLLDRRCGQYLLAAYRFITAGEYSANLMPGPQQGGKAFGGYIRGSHEQDAHKF